MIKSYTSVMHYWFYRLLAENGDISLTELLTKGAKVSELSKIFCWRLLFL